MSILTGYSSTNSSESAASSLDYDIAILSDQMTRFPQSSTPPGYMITTNATQREQAHYSARWGYDAKLAAHDNKYRDTISIGEMASAWTLTQPAAEWKGKALLVAGSDDAFACPNAGSVEACEAVLRKTAAARLPGAEVVEVYSPEGVGHNLNLHYGANETWATMEEFILRFF